MSTARCWIPPPTSAPRSKASFYDTRQNQRHAMNSCGATSAAICMDLVPGAAAGDDSASKWRLMIADYRRIYLARHHGSTRAYPGVAEALAALPGRKSTATTKGTPTTRLVLEKFGLASLLRSRTRYRRISRQARAGRDLRVAQGAWALHPKIVCWWAMRRPTWKPDAAPV